MRNLDRIAEKMVKKEFTLDEMTRLYGHPYDNNIYSILKLIRGYGFSDLCVEKRESSIYLTPLGICSDNGVRRDFSRQPMERKNKQIKLSLFYRRSHPLSIWMFKTDVNG